MHKEKPKINCQTFQKQESVIKDITDKMNQDKRILEKAEFAEELQRKAEVLLCCPDYDDKRLDCKNCHFITSLRKKTSNLIIKAKKIKHN